MSGPASLDVVVVGGANVDLLAKGTELPGPGQSVRMELLQEAPGGKGANQAVAVARLGGRAALVACVGGGPIGARARGRLPGAPRPGRPAGLRARR